jgi:hypothetical protein
LIKTISTIIFTNTHPPHTHTTPFTHQNYFRQAAVSFERVCKRSSSLVTHLIVALKRMCYTACGAKQPNMKTQKKVEDKATSDTFQEAKRNTAMQKKMILKIYDKNDINHHLKNPSPPPPHYFLL